MGTRIHYSRIAKSLTCERCERSFEWHETGRGFQAKYCDTCRRNSTRCECQRCRKVFWRNGYVTPYCTTECKRIANGWVVKNSKLTKPELRSEPKPCEGCGVMVATGRDRPGKMTFCSRDCFQEWYKKGDASCGYCRKELGRPARRRVSRTGVPMLAFCNAKCQADYFHPPKCELCEHCFGERGKCTCVTDIRERERWGDIPKEWRSVVGAAVAAPSVVSDPWMIRCHNAITSLCIRKRDQYESLSRRRRVAPPSSWQECIARQLMAIREKRRRADRNEWARKCESTARNWRRKSNARNSSTTLPTGGATGLQGCIHGEAADSRDGNARPQVANEQRWGTRTQQPSVDHERCECGKGHDDSRGVLGPMHTSCRKIQQEWAFDVTC